MKKLELIFENAVGKNATYSLDSPVEPVDAEAINAAMDTIITEDIFMTSGGNIVKKKGARIVERHVEDIDIDIDEA